MPAGIILCKSSIQLDAVGQVPFRGIFHHYSQVIVSVENLLKPAGEHAGEYALVNKGRLQDRICLCWPVSTDFFMCKPIQRQPCRHSNLEA